MEFKVRKKTFLKSKDNTTNIMYSILVILVLFILFALDPLIEWAE